MQRPEDRHPADQWQSPAGPAAEDPIVTDEQAADAGETQSPDRAYPSPEDQAYAPAGRAHHPADPGYPQPGQAYPVGDQAYLPADQAYPPGDQGYLPADQAYPSGDQGYLPADQAYPSGDQGHLPANEAYPSGDQGHLPANEAYPPGDQGYLSEGQGYPPEEMRAPAEMPRRRETPAGDAAVSGGQMPVSEAAVSPAGETERRWSEILAMFVDDPRASVKLAAGLLDQAVEDLVTTVRQRQASLASAWQDSDAGTEALRGALRDYRAFWAVLQSMAPAGPASPHPGATSPNPGATSPRGGMYPDAAGAGPDGPGRDGASA